MNGLTQAGIGDLGLFIGALVFSTLAVAYALTRRFYRTEAGWHVLTSTILLAVIFISLTTRKLPFIPDGFFQNLRPFLWWIGVAYGIWRWSMFLKGFRNPAAKRRPTEKENAS